MLVHRPHTVTDGVNPNLFSTWRSPFAIRSKVSPVIYRVGRDGGLAESSVHLGRVKNFALLNPMLFRYHRVGSNVFGGNIPIPDLDGTVFTHLLSRLVRIPSKE